MTETRAKIFDAALVERRGLSASELRNALLSRYDAIPARVPLTTSRSSLAFGGGDDDDGPFVDEDGPDFVDVHPPAEPEPGEGGGEGEGEGGGGEGGGGEG